ncbi:hypothetical protein [Haloarcula argentinensis]|uniref:Uncharacterized protein n=1 Tax=Haloarcula argentinensis TaxID=43776 RepID=A0A847UL27_HALAR|nr:hypothetical protein [Haloarcula argentinensis]NLV14359.1 hypothetical protein [Haloarcula argentinensis]
MFEFQADTGKGIVVLAFVVAVLFFVVFTTSPSAAILGAGIAAVVLTVLYYLGVRVDVYARGGRR